MCVRVETRFGVDHEKTVVVGVGGPWLVVCCVSVQVSRSLCDLDLNNGIY